MMPSCFQLSLFLLVAFLFSCSGSSGSVPADDDLGADPMLPGCEELGFYIDSTEGSDTNSGSSSCEPWQTLEHAFSSIMDNSVVFLKRGEVWNEGIVLNHSNITIDAYGVAAEAPILDGRTSVSGWQPVVSDIYSVGVSLSSDQLLGHVARNGSVMFFQGWAGDAESSFASAPDNSFTYDNAANTIYIKTSSNPEQDNYLVSTAVRGVFAEDLAGIRIQNIEIVGFSLHGIEFKNCDTCSAISVSVNQVGAATISGQPGNLLYAGNGIEFGNGSRDGLVQDSEISQIFDSCLTPQTYASAQTVSDIRFVNSTLSQCGFAGVEISVLSVEGSVDASVSSIFLHGLLIENVGRGWSGQRYGTDGYGVRIQSDDGAGTIDSVQVSNTEIINSINSGIRASGDIGSIAVSQTQVVGNGGFGIDISEANKTSPFLNVNTSIIANNSQFGVNFNCANCAGLQIHQNTFSSNDSINLAIFAQNNTADIRNNIFHSVSDLTHLFAQAELVGLTLDHNCYHQGVNMIGYAGTAYQSLDTFVAAESFEINGVSTSDLNLSDPISGNYQLMQSSSCIGIGGTDVGVTVDIIGRAYASPPSAGAYAL